MSNWGVTKGTEFEKAIEDLSKGEISGASMYSSLAYLAKERGLDEVSEKLMNIAVDELRHAGLYAVLNGQVDDAIFGMLEKMAPVERGGVEKLQQFAKSLRAVGLESVSEQIELVAFDEGCHGETLEKLIKDFK